MSVIEARQDRAENAPKPTVRIRPSKGWVALDLKELWTFRELIYFFAWREVKVRYKQTIIGAGWAIIQPFVTMVIFSLFFGKLASMPSDGVPYPIFSFAALVPWSYFSAVMTNTSNTIIANSNMIKKIYFPRLAMPVSAILTAGIDFVLQFAVLLGMLFYYDIALSWKVLWLPLLLLLAVVTSLGVGLWLSALNVRFRDVRHMLAFIVQVWFFATPITYASSLLPAPWSTIYGINPMAGVVEGFRWALIGTDTQPGTMVVLSAITAVAILISGLYYFRRMESTFADLI